MVYLWFIPQCLQFNWRNTGSDLRAGTSCKILNPIPTWSSWTNPASFVKGEARKISLWWVRGVDPKLLRAFLVVKSVKGCWSKDSCCISQGILCLWEINTAVGWMVVYVAKNEKEKGFFYFFPPLIVAHFVLLIQDLAIKFFLKT